jgi:microcystin-dependent protein
MAGNRYVPTIFTALDTNGAPIPGAKLYFYVNETTTPKDTYSDVDLSVANPWPVEADGAGRFTDDIFMATEAYRIKLTDENDVQIWSKDDCNTFNGAASGNAFPFPGAVVEFYGTQGQLDVATAAFWYIMDGNNGLPNLDDTYIKACIDVASIGSTGGTTTPTGTVEDHTLTSSQVPTHSHFISNSDATSTASPSLGAGDYLTRENGAGGFASYILNGNSTVATVGKTSSSGSGGSHNHSLTMDTYDPPYYQLIKLVYLGY